MSGGYGLGGGLASVPSAGRTLGDGADVRDVEGMAGVIERFSGAIRRLGQRLDAEFVHGDPIAMDHRRRPRHDRLGQRFIGDLEIGLILQRRHPQRVPVVAEAVLRLAVFGKPRPEFDRQAEQVLHRPLVLAARQPAEGRGLGFRQLGLTVPLRDPGRHQLPVFLPESRCLLGRHVAELEAVHHDEPIVAIVALDEIGIELVDPQLPLGLFDAVTGVAMLLEQRLDPGEGDRIVRAKRRRPESCEQSSERENPPLRRMMHWKKFRSGWAVLAGWQCLII